MAKDPVCGMQVDEEKAAATAEYRGEIYYFCSKGCRAAFEKDPKRYAEAKGEMKHGHGCC